MVIICDNDMEIILKGDQVTAIREMLRDRLFALIKMPEKKPERYISKFSSSVFVGHMNGILVYSLAIREKGSLTIFEDCRYYLSIYRSRGNKTFKTPGSYSNDKEIFDNNIERLAFPGTEVTYPSIDELLAFVVDKEFAMLTNFVEEHDMENTKSRHFLDFYVLLRENYNEQFFRNDSFHDIRVFLTRVEEDGVYPEYDLYPEDINKFDVKERITDCLKKHSKESLYDKRDLYLEYEARSPEIQAAYFVTRFHSNPNWDADPVNILNFRICAFVLPGTVSPRKAKKFPSKKQAIKRDSGSKYVIDSIHVNSNICYDLSELEELICLLFGDVFMD